jgi:hypothetical protein
MSKKSVTVTKAVLCLHIACCLLGLFIVHKDGGSMFLRNTGELLPDHMVSHPKNHYSYFSTACVTENMGKERVLAVAANIS